MKIRWTPTAKITYFKVLDYLAKNWTIKEIKNFTNEVESVLNQIAENPYMFEASRNSKNIRKGFITKHNILYYRIKPRKKEIELLTFWFTAQSPERLSYL
jgi:plasmid stabilization system protein ParE